jgi:non-ribosomal peptide synthase protein (TIGR01720 family)
MLPSTFVFLDALPLAASGKVDRRALPSPEGDRPDLAEAYVEPRTPVEQQLAAIWAQVLGIERVGVHDDFFGLGGDSILSMQVVSRAHQAGLQLTPRDVFQYQTVAKLAAVAGTAAAPQVEQGVVTGPVPLTPIQHWFFAQQLSDPHHFNQSVLLTAPSGFDVARLEQVVRATLEHHDALRLRFEQKDGQWRQVNVAPADEALVMRVDLCQASEAQVAAAIEREAARLQASLNLGTGPLLRVGYFDLGTERAGRLLLVIHHLAVDGVSWRVLLEDVQTAYSQLSRGEAIQLPAKTTSFKHWAERLAAYAQSEALQAELDYWLAEAQPQVASIPTDYAMTEGANLAVSEDSITVALNGDETLALLQQVPQAYHTQIHEVLLTALAQVLAEWTSRNVVLIDLEGHGREEIFEDVALSRTVGWFTSVFPMRVRLNGAAHPGELLQSVKEQVRQVPNRGLGYGILRYLSASGAARLSALPQPEVSFNYLGQFDQVGTSGTLALATESAGPDVSPRASRLHLLDIVGQVVGGQLKLQWIYSRKLYRQSTIKELAHKFMETLRNLVAHCLSPEVGGYSPSDFPLVGVDQGELDKAISLFDF